METKLTSFATVTAAFVKALATVAEEIGVKAAISAVKNKGEQLTQMIRLIFTALTTGQDLILAGDQARTERPSILKSIGTRAVSAVKEFIAKNHFIVGTTKGVKIAFVSDNFKKHFLGKVETNVAGALLRAYKLLKDSPDPRIITDLGDNYPTTLAYMWELIVAQPNGEDGTLLTDGKANIFYIQDVDGTFRAVYALWYGLGWYFYAYSVDYPDPWNADSQAFGCDDSKTPSA